MPIGQSPIPSNNEPLDEIAKQLQMLVVAQREVAFTTLTAAIVAAMDRPVTLAEVLDIRRDISFTLNPQPTTGVYKNWQDTRAKQLSEPYR